MMRQRQRKQTLLIYCEGEHDSLFVRHLKKLYAPSNKKITIQTGHGGGPSALLDKVIRRPAEYDKKCIFLDSDQQVQKQTKNKAQEHNVTLIHSPLCLENLFFQILNSHPQMFEAKKCKSLFKKRYNNQSDKYSLQMMDRLFPKNLLNEKKNEIPSLNKLIQIISGPIV